MQDGAVDSRCHVVRHFVLSSHTAHVLQIELKAAVLECLECRGRYTGRTAFLEARELCAHFLTVFGYAYGAFLRPVGSEAHRAETQAVGRMHVAQLRDEPRYLAGARRCVARIVQQGHALRTRHEPVKVVGSLVFRTVGGRQAESGTQIVRNHCFAAAALREDTLVHRQHEHVVEVEATRLGHAHYLHSLERRTGHSDSARIECPLKKREIRFFAGLHAMRLHKPSEVVDFLAKIRQLGHLP